MTDRVHYHPNLIFSAGTQFVTLVDIAGSAGLNLHPRGTVGIVVKSPTDLEHAFQQAEGYAWRTGSPYIDPALQPSSSFWHRFCPV